MLQTKALPWRVNCRNQDGTGIEQFWAVPWLSPHLLVTVAVYLIGWAQTWKLSVSKYIKMRGQDYRSLLQECQIKQQDKNMQRMEVLLYSFIFRKTLCTSVSSSHQGDKEHIVLKQDEPKKFCFNQSSQVNLIYVAQNCKTQFASGGCTICTTYDTHYW